MSVMAAAANVSAVQPSQSTEKEVRMATAKDSVPANPTITLSADPNRGPYVKIKVTVPTKDKSGNPVTTVTKMTLYRANKEYKTFVPEEGQVAIIYNDTVPTNNMSYTYAIVATNKYGNSAKVSKSVYVGTQKPKAPENIVVSADKTNHRKGRVTWTPPAKDAGNLDLDPSTLTYKVSLRDHKGKLTVLKEGLTSLSYDFEYTGEGYGLFTLIVNAVNIGGTSSNGTSSNKIFLGEPIVENMAESFPKGNATEPLLYGYEATGPGLSWRPVDGTILPGITGCDNDNGYLGVQGINNAIGLMMTNYVDPSKFTSPCMSVNVLKLQGQPDIDLQLIATVDSNTFVLKQLNLRDLAHEGWNLVSADLSAYKGRLPQVGLRVLFHDNYVYFHADNLRIGDAPASDLGIGILTGPDIIQRGIPTQLTTTVYNYAGKDSKPYSVKLMRDDRVIATLAMPSLKALTSMNVTMPDTLNVAATDSLAVYRMLVSMEGDANPANDSTLTGEATLIPSGLPPVRMLTSKSTTSLDLKWEAPDMNRMPAASVVETFETYTPFSGNFGPWINIDGDKRNVGGFTVNGNKLPVTGPQGFWVFDTDSFPSSSLTPAIGGGKRYAASLYTNDGLPTNDWLISPELNGASQLLEMDILAYFNFEVPWEIMYSTTGRDTTDFQLLKADKYDRTWKKFCYHLPEGTKYFAIHSCHIGPVRGPLSPLFCFDNVKYVPAGKGEGTLLGYNIYCDDQLLTPVPVTTTAYKGTALPGTGHLYKVSAVYDRGESMPMEVDITKSVNYVEEGNISVEASFGTINITSPASAHVTIYNMQGSLILSKRAGECGTSIPMLPGCYLVRIANKTFKVLVR